MRASTLVATFAAAVAAQGSDTASSVATITSSASLESATASTSNSSSSGPVTHTVAVAKAAHKFSPDVVLAEVGDTIEFQFYPTNHSVIRAAYGYPCVPYEMVLGVGYYGFFSGFEPVDAVLDEPPNWSVVVNDTQPIFYYCGAPNSCIGYEMVGVINPNASTSLDHQKQLAGQSSFMLTPGEDWPAEGSPSGVATSSAAPSATSANTAATVTAIATANHGLSTGAIAGIAIGGAAVLLLAAVAIWTCGRQSRRNQTPMPGAPAQEVHSGFAPVHGSMYGKPSHMSMVSGYSMPPGYDNQAMRSPTMQSMQSPVDPMMGQQPPLAHSSTPSPNLQPSAPAYGHNHPVSMYAVGTHNVAPVEMDSTAAINSSRKSIEKRGVERYS